MDTVLFAGFNCADVTPSKPCHMAGYNRAEPNDGVLDPIQVNSIAIKVNGEPFILTVLDSIMLEEEFCNRVKREVAARTGASEENIAVACIHTHSAPAFFKLAFEDTQVEPELTAHAGAAMVESAVAAFRNLEPVHATLEKAQIEGLYGNRNVRGGAAEKTCYLLTFRDAAGKAAGALFNISAHPTILNGSSRVLSADLIGQVRLRLEEELGCTVVCTNGTCGDVSTRFYRTASGMDELMNTSQAIFDQVMAKKQPVALTGGPVEHGAFSMPSVYDAATDADWQHMTDELAARLEHAEQAGTTDPGATMLLDRQQRKLAMGPVHLNLVCQHYRFGNLLVVTLPADVCSELGMRIKRALPTYEVILVCYANAYCNYLVPQEDYGKYFETYNARTARGVPDAFIEAIIASITSTAACAAAA